MRMAARSGSIRKYRSRVALPYSGNDCAEWAASNRRVRGKPRLPNIPHFWRKFLDINRSNPLLHQGCSVFLDFLRMATSSLGLSRQEGKLR
jgi:hypothetical protein